MHVPWDSCLHSRESLPVWIFKANSSSDTQVSPDVDIVSIAST